MIGPRRYKRARAGSTEGSERNMQGFTPRSPRVTTFAIRALPR
jgi:hypothetical protein